MLMTTLFFGGTAVLLEIFDPGKTLEAIEKYRVRLLGQIPAMFLMEWRHSDYGKRDLSSLDIVVYGGQAVPRPFLDKLKTMAPRIATGLGLTEASGFCTFTPPTGDMDELAAGIGPAMELYPMTIREPMHGDGRAGAELPAGQSREGADSTAIRRRVPPAALRARHRVGARIASAADRAAVCELRSGPVTPCPSPDRFPAPRQGS